MSTAHDWIWASWFDFTTTIAQSEIYVMIKHEYLYFTTLSLAEDFMKRRLLGFLRKHTKLKEVIRSIYVKLIITAKMPFSV